MPLAIRRAATRVSQNIGHDRRPGLFPHTLQNSGRLEPQLDQKSHDTTADENDSGVDIHHKDRQVAPRYCFQVLQPQFLTIPNRIVPGLSARLISFNLCYKLLMPNAPGMACPGPSPNWCLGGCQEWLLPLLHRSASTTPKETSGPRTI